MIDRMSSAPAPIAPTASPAAPAVPGRENRAFDAPTTALCIKMLQALRNGLSQALLYTLETKQFEKSADITFQAINELLEKIGNFTLGISRSEALFNGQRVEIPNA